MWRILWLIKNSRRINIFGFRFDFVQFQQFYLPCGIYLVIPSLPICCEMSRHAADACFEHLRKITKLFRVSSCNFYSRPFHIRGFIIFQILFWHREIEVARAVTPELSSPAVYRAIPWFRNIAWRTRSNFRRSRERDRELSENSRKFFPAMTAARVPRFPSP